MSLKIMEAFNNILAVFCDTIFANETNWSETTAWMLKFILRTAV
jgi:hypothetical protein